MGQLKTHSKSNEITAIPELLKLLAIKGCIVTTCAMGSQRAIVRQILDQQGDYLVTLKGNHKNTYRAVTRYFHDHVEHNFSLRDEDTFFDAFDVSHGRRVRRRLWVLRDLGGIAELEKWPGVNSIIAVETIRTAHVRAKVTSSASIFDHGIEMMQLDPCISGGKAPVHHLARPAALFGPRADLLTQRLEVGYPSVQALPGAR